MTNLEPRNNLSRSLLEVLGKIGVRGVGGYFGGKKYCVAVKVCSVGEAANIGMEIGSGWGEIDFDIWPNGTQFIVFRDALVQEKSNQQ
jgi:hypothetical protein